MQQTELPGLGVADSSRRIEQLLAQAAELSASDPAAALAMSDGARAMALRLDDQHGVARALLRGALCQARLAREARGAHPGAEAPGTAWLTQAIALFHGLEDLQGEAEACNLLANLHAVRSEHSSALALYHRSLALRRRQGDRMGEAGLLNNIGLVLRDTGQYPDALACLVSSLELAEAAGAPRATAHALASIGSVLADLDETPRATEYLLRALALLADRPDPSLEAATRTSLGRVLAQIGHTEEARLHLHQALAIAQRSGQLVDLGAALLALGVSAETAGETARAEWLLQEALSATRRTANRLAEADALLALGRCRLRQGHAQAVGLIEQALALAEPLHADPLCARIHQALSSWHESQGRFEPALRHHKAFHDCRQRIVGQGVQRRLRSLLVRADLERAHRLAEDERRRGLELEIALDEVREADRQKDELLATLSRQAEMLRQLAREDGLTGVANRRWLDAQFERERERARRHGHALSVAMIDIDHFKAINDRCSHRVGDEVLRRVARLLRDACRSGDIVGRYGGEEFMVVLVETPLAAARGVCEKLRALVVGQHWADLHPELQRVSVSIGLAGDAEDPVACDLAGAADQQLYRAKREGRNRVCAPD